MFTYNSLLLLPGLFTLSLGAMAMDMPATPTISVIGHGIVEQKPDKFILNITVSGEAKQASEAKLQIDKRVSRYLTFLHQHQVVDKDINAANLIIQPRYEYNNDQSPVLTGYQAKRKLRVSLNNNSDINLFLDAALRAGLDEINSVIPTLSSIEDAHAKARQLAVADAIKQASSLAKGFSAELGPVWSIDYQSSRSPAYDIYSVTRTAGNAGNGMDKSWQQSVKLEDQVSVTFTLKPHQP